MATARRPTGTTLSLEVHDDVASLEEEWDALATRTGASPFVRPGWIAAWYDAFCRGTPLVAAVRREGLVAAVGAFELRRGSVRSATNWHTPVYDVVADSPEAAGVLAEGVLALRPRRVELRFLDRDGIALATFGAATAAARYPVLTRTLQRSPYLALDGDWDAYAATLSPTRMKELARRWRGLEREGPVTVEVEAGEGSLEALEEGFRLEASGWKGRSGTAILSQPETRRFYESIARWAAARGWLRLSFLRLAGRPLAFQLDLEADGTVYHLKPGYDESYGRFRPGKLLTRELLRRAFEGGARSYEFLGGPDPHKLEWTSRVRELFLLQAFAPSPAGLAQLGAFRFGRPAAAHALSGVVRLRRGLARRGGS